MLVLNRKNQETIVITPPGMEPIIIQIIDIRGDKVRMGFEAEIEIEILRGELVKHEPLRTLLDAMEHKPVSNPTAFRPGRDS